MKACPRRITITISEPTLLHGLNILSKQCNNQHIRTAIQCKNKILPACKAHWSSIFTDINWKNTWLFPFNYCINNKIKELHWKIVHNIYPTNLYASKFSDKNSKCSFCDLEIESVTHLFYECTLVQNIWTKLELFLYQKTYHITNLKLQNIVTCYVHKNKNIEFMVNLYILYAKFHIHKAKFLNYKPSFITLSTEIKQYYQILKKINNKKAIKTINIAEQLNLL